MDFKSPAIISTLPYGSEKDTSNDDTSTILAQIPSSISISYQSSWSKLLCSSVKGLNLTPGPTSINQTPFKVCLPGGFSGSIVLDHAQHSTTPLARAIPGDRRSYELLLPGTTAAESLRRRPRKCVWWFAAPTARNGELEVFEWRRSHGNEVKQLGGSRWGWKLVRVGRAGRDEPPEGKESFDASELSDDGSLAEYEKGRAEASTSDGKEVVAVWARTGLWTSLHDVGEFQLLGSGATGELGDRWAVMALMSILCIWQKAMRDQSAAAASSSTTVVVS